MKLEWIFSGKCAILYNISSMKAYLLAEKHTLILRFVMTKESAIWKV